MNEFLIPTPPFWGSRVLADIPLRAIAPYINKIALYKLQWGYKPKGLRTEEFFAWAAKELDPILLKLIQKSETDGILKPQAIYGYYPCHSDGNILIVYDHPDTLRECCRFDLPRQAGGDKRCIADFFAPKTHDALDVVAFQVVTVGQKTSDYARELFANNHYQDYLYWHGLNAEGAESLAEFIHKRIRVELGNGHEDHRDIQKIFQQYYRGSRYSFGYPACPDLHEQHKILTLLEANRIGVVLGDEDQLWPEESTTAIVVHHPDAKYFRV